MEDKEMTLEFDGVVRLERVTPDPPPPCKFCGGDTAQGLVYCGPIFKYLDDGEQACAPCWIEHVVEERVKELVRTIK